MQGCEPFANIKNKYELIIRQQPVHSRMCGIGERVDRRPIDPPPVVQLKINGYQYQDIEVVSSSLFLVALLVPANIKDDEEVNLLFHSKSTVGRTVSSLHHLRDLDGTESAFFVFSDISVRPEGNYRLKMCLFDMEEQEVHYKACILTDPFTVYSAKTFPGMYRSCPLVQNFAKQGLKIKVRREAGPRTSKFTNPRKTQHIRRASTLEENETLRPLSESGNALVKRRSTLDADEIPYKRRLSLSYLLDTPINSITQPQNDYIKWTPTITKNNYQHATNNNDDATSKIISFCT